MSPLLASTQRRLLREVAHTQRAGRIPSVAAGVVRDGEPVWFGTRGRTVRDGEEAPATADTQYKVGSVTKTMTAALVLLAAERGELRLSDRLGRFLPGGPFADASLRDLLCHRAGLTAEPHGVWWERTRGGDLAALVAAHVGAQPVLEPGSRLHYSNLGYGLLGAVVAEVTGRTWADALRAEVLAPLGLDRTTYQQRPPFAEGFSVDALTGALTSEPLPDTGAMAPAGQLWSTVADLSRWATALVDPGRSVLTEASLVAMRTPQVGSPEDRTGTSWGLGVSLVRDRGRVLLGHGGSMPGFVCGLLVDVDTGTASVVLTNGGYGLDDLPRRLLETVLEHDPPLGEEWRPTRSVPEGTRELLGTWHWGHAPSLVTWNGTELRLDPVRGNGRSMAFVPSGEPDTWVGVRGYLTGETLRPVRRADGSVSHLECATFVYTRTPYDPAAPVPGGPPPRD